MWTHHPYRPTQRVDVLDQQTAIAFEQVKSEEGGAVGNPVTALYSI
jgi:hypothetical protein